MSKIYDDHKVCFICKPCKKEWTGECKRGDFNRHADSHYHNLAIEHLLKSATPEEINNRFCYEERDLGFEINKTVIDGEIKRNVRATCRIGLLKEKEPEDSLL